MTKENVCLCVSWNCVMEHVFGHEKEGNPAICDIMMNPEGIMIK